MLVLWSIVLKKRERRHDKLSEMIACDNTQCFPNCDRDVEFPQLKGSVYVDHAGTTLYSKTQIEAYHRELLSNLFGNPHSRSQSSRLATDAIDQVRFRILKFFNTTSEEYTVIFTSGCTGALKTIAESFTFDEDRSCHGDCKDSKYGCHDSASKVKKGCFAYLQDNHTSVQGMREIVKDRVGHILCIEQMSELIFKTHLLQLEQKEQNQKGNCLFVYPAQSNYCGHKYPTEWINAIHQNQLTFQRSFSGRWFVVLDAASYASTSRLDLGNVKPDFVTLSFYKMFGLPTGLGALLVRNGAAPFLEKKYFGGGTVAVSSPTELFHINRESLSDRFEDGTVPFLDIIALRHGFDALERLGGGIKTISNHTFSVAQYFHHHLQSLCHGNGQPVADIYCHGDFSNPTKQGPIVNFNLIRHDGSYIGFAEVDKMAQLYNIHLRTGCFCNIGACQKYLRLSSEQIKENFEAGHVCGDDKDLINGMPTGSVRVSFGYMSTIGDAQHCLKFICECFLENSNKPDFNVDVYSNLEETNKSLKKIMSVIPNKNSEWTEYNNKFDWANSESVIEGKCFTNCSEHCDNNSKDMTAENINIEKQYSDCLIVPLTDSHNVLQKCSTTNRIVTNIYLYPVKSCGAFEVTEWEVCDTGLLYDREWMIVSESGVTISQKREPRLCLIQPKIDLVNKSLTLTYTGMCPITIPLDSSDKGQGHQATLPCVGKVCGDRITGVDCGDKVGQWISEALQKPGCRLIQQCKDDSRKCRLQKSSAGEEKSRISLANESQYLLISRESVKNLRQRIQEKTQSPTFDLGNLVQRFRANIVVGGGYSFDEDSWSSVQIGQEKFVSQGGCSRCQMVCLDQLTGERSKEPLRTLAEWRGKKILFGIHLRHETATIGKKIKVGDLLTVD